MCQKLTLDLCLVLQASRMKVRRSASTHSCSSGCHQSTRPHYRLSSTTSTGQQHSRTLPHSVCVCVCLCEPVCMCVCASVCSVSPRGTRCRATLWPSSSAPLSSRQMARTTRPVAPSRTSLSTTNPFSRFGPIWGPITSMGTGHWGSWTTLLLLLLMLLD